MKKADRERSPRKARICTKCNRRHFGDLSWRCREHPASTVDQPDNPYFGELPRLPA